ncbi:hypothetical protein R6Q59_028204 [Mikania micrantha]
MQKGCTKQQSKVHKRTNKEFNWASSSEDQEHKWLISWTCLFKRRVTENEDSSNKRISSDTNKSGVVPVVSRSNHTNLIGKELEKKGELVTMDGDEKLVIYDYVPHGSLVNARYEVTIQPPKERLISVQTSTTSFITAEPSNFADQHPYAGDAMTAPPSSISISTDTTTASHPISVPTSTIRLLSSRLSSSLRRSFSQNRPWSELADRTSFSRPISFSDATVRIRRNFSYFRVNYTTILACVIAVSLISHPFSLLLLLGLLAAWIFLYVFRPADQPLVLFRRAFSGRETLVILIFFTIVVVFLTNVGSVMISALLIGLAILCVHGGFRVPEDLFLDDQEPVNGGFLSFLGGAGSSAAAATAPVVPRV